MKVSQLMERLQELPQERTVMCQLVAEDEPGAWNMFFEFENVDSSDWLVQLRVYHPELKRLPTGDP